MTLAFKITCCVDSVKRIQKTSTLRNKGNPYEGLRFTMISFVIQEIGLISKYLCNFEVDQKPFDIYVL